MKTGLTALTLALAATSAHGMTDAQLREVVDQRLQGDRTGACLAVAVIENDRVARRFACANADASPRIDARSAFEIGSVSKTMTSALLADLILEGRASLDDPLAAYLPDGTEVPQFEGSLILLRHVVTHTSGLPALPSHLQGADQSNPYAKLDEKMLLASLGDAALRRAPGSKFEYSNFASMLLSYAVARRAGKDFEVLLDERLFEPLGMQGAYVNRQPEGVRPAAGHAPNASPTPAWTFQTDLAGVGGVRATLDDMVRYVQGHLDRVEAPITPALRLSRQQVSEQPPVAMNWMLPKVGGNIVHLHEGGTGGFSSFVAFDTARDRGVVILSDTTWNAIGGLGSLGLHLLDASMPLGKPRIPVTPDSALLDALAGEYRLLSGLPVMLRRKGDVLTVQAEGQPEFEMGYDSAGDFYPLQFDSVLTPERKDDGSYVFNWKQMGGVIPARRIDASAAGKAPKTPATKLPAEELAEYTGTYPLMPGFELTVRAKGGQLHAQATGQGEFPLEHQSKDQFAAPAFDIEIHFNRDDAGDVASLELHQAGQVLTGKRK